MTEYETILPSQLFFGLPAAEREAHLDQYFFESASYQRLLSGQKTIVLGNRGAGKTAILRGLALQARGTIVVQLAPDDYSYEMLESTLRKEVEGSWAKQGAYAAAWKYVLYISAMKAVTNRTPKMKHGAAGKLYSFLRDNQINIDTNPIGALISYIKRLEGVKIGSYEARLKARELARLYRLEELERPIGYLATVAAERPVMILVDELDRGWDNSEDARAFVAGLFNAATAINQEMRHVRVILSLRLELFNSIPSLFDDAQKYRDLIEFLVWDESSLMKLMHKRLQVCLPEVEFLQPEHLWNRVFVENLGEGRGTSFRYLINRTLFRPRELIQFCEFVREAAIKRTAGVPFGFDLIQEAEPLHSETRLHDIAAEYRFDLPVLEPLFESFRGMPARFDRAGLEYHCLRVCAGDIGSADLKEWCENRDPALLIDLLWNVGFLRGQAPGQVSRGHTEDRPYLAFHQAHGLNSYTIRHFEIHPMFWSYLGVQVLE
jgi:hypothetical protein